MDDSDKDETVVLVYDERDLPALNELANEAQQLRDALREVVAIHTSDDRDLWLGEPHDLRGEAALRVALKALGELDD
jgi:hypothetical protein